MAVPAILYAEDNRILLHAVNDLAAQARQAGANEFLRKPNNIVDLLDTIRRLLGAQGSK